MALQVRKATKADGIFGGVWGFQNPGADPFGPGTRRRLSAVEVVQGLAPLGYAGCTFHDNDLWDFGATPAQRDAALESFIAALRNNGMTCPMATVNLFSAAIFKAGAFTANNRLVRAFAIKKAMDAIDAARAAGAKTFVLWGGREGFDYESSIYLERALGWYRDAVHTLCEYIKRHGYDLKIALEAKPNAPRASILFPTTGSMLGSIATLDPANQGMVGVNPEVAHEKMANAATFTAAIAEAWHAGKLFQFDLNGQYGARFDQDLSFGSDDIIGTVHLVRFLKRVGYSGLRHIDAHPLRTEGQKGTWTFAHRCVRNWKIAEAQVERIDNDPAIRQLLDELEAADNPVDSEVFDFSTPVARAKAVVALADAVFDVTGLGARETRFEALDQLFLEAMQGVDHEEAA